MRQKKRLIQVIRAATLISKWREEADKLSRRDLSQETSTARENYRDSVILKICAIELERALLTEKPIN